MNITLNDNNSFFFVSFLVFPRKCYKKITCTKKQIKKILQVITPHKQSNSIPKVRKLYIDGLAIKRSYKNNIDAVLMN